jgi:hypothetical protein
MKVTTNRTRGASRLTNKIGKVYSEKALSEICSASDSSLFWEWSTESSSGLFLLEKTMPVELSNNHNFKNLTGQKFHFLTVVEYAGRKRIHSYWKCVCDCGKTTFALATDLKTGHKKSCGCYQSIASRQRKTTHGLYYTPERQSYQSAKNRCQNVNNKAFPDYGGRGIEFRFKSILDLIAEIGFKPTPQHTLDRINNNGHYERGNVRWATRTEQNQNKRSSIVIINGIRKTKKEWAKFLGVSHGTFVGRLLRGWCQECIMRQSHKGKPCNHRKF